MPDTPDFERTKVQNHDFAAIRQSDGLYVLQEFRDGDWAAVAGHEGRYDEAEARRRLGLLRPFGDGWIGDGPGHFELVQP